MKAYWSPSTGTIARLEETGLLQFESLAGAPIAAPRHSVSNIDDWEPVGAIEDLPQRFRTHRVIAILRAALAGLQEETTRAVLADAERAIQEGADTDRVKSELCVAPLRTTHHIQNLATLASAQGALAVAEILDFVHQAQPRLRHLTNIWLTLTLPEIAETGTDRLALWMAVVESRALVKILTATDRRGLTHAWNPLVLRLGPLSANESRALVKLGVKIAETLGFGRRRGSQELAKLEDDRGYANDENNRRNNHRVHSWQQERDRALKQIDSIASEIGLGNDDRAHKFLRDLVRSQESTPEYLVKSLCHVAQRSKLLFRFDFERECLRCAREITPDDPWLLVQWGNHLKDCGEFEAARDAFEAARVHGDPVADTSLADLLVAEGNLNAALAFYKGLPTWRSSQREATAIADVLRKMGRYDEARAQYEYILQRWPADDRARAGVAEIHRAEGRRDRALMMYSELAREFSGASSEEAHVYALSECVILKEIGETKRAFFCADNILQRWPFHRSAQFLKNALLILLDREAEVDTNLPESAGFSGYGEWARSFNRGLMLLATNRFAAAQRELLGGISRLRKESSDTLLRLAAAQASLGNGNYEKARELLLVTGPIPKWDEYMEYLRAVLQLHASAAVKDHSTATRLRKFLDSSGDADIQSAVVQITKSDFKSALAAELRLLARCA
jgi:tetratricopeptide (TPR) repeat protein